MAAVRVEVAEAAGPATNSFAFVFCKLIYQVSRPNGRLLFFHPSHEKTDIMA